MKRSLFFLTLLAAALLHAAELTVLATADTHADTLGWARIAPLIAEERERAGAENTLLIDAGDTLQGHVDGSFRDGAIPLAILNFLRFDVWVPGNHDFAYRPYRFGAFRGTVLGGDWKTGDFTPQAWRMFERAGHKVAVIGLGESGLAKRLLPDSGVRFEDQEKVLSRAVSEALAAGAELLIWVRHDGLYAPSGPLFGFLRRHPEIALVIGAHTHQEIAGKKVGRAWFVQPGARGNCLGVVRVRFRQGDVPEMTSELRCPAPDAPLMRWPPELFAMIREARSLARQTVGHAAAPLRPPTGRDWSGALGDLAETALRRETGAAVTLVTTYRPAEAWEKGVTAPTRAEFFRLMPYENRICRADLTPDVLREVIRDLVALQRRRKNLSVRFGGVRVYRDKHGKLQRAVLPPPGPDGRIPVALTDYELTGCGGGMPDVFSRGPWRDTGVLLRDAAARLLAP